VDQHPNPIEEDYEAVRARAQSRFGRYLPNRVSPSERIACCVFALALIAHATMGVYIDDLVIPGRRRSPPTHLSGWEAWLFAGAIYSFAASFISRVVDHYDKKNNEHLYRWFEKSSGYVAAGFVALSFLHRVLS
jgi:hypothetical protein